mgnify:CR=1 FL=1
MECVMSYINVSCPICGTINRGVDLEETEGWVECSCCKTDFVPKEYVHRVIQSSAHIGTSVLELNLKLVDDSTRRAS